MAYLRGETYIWRDEGGFHFWAKDGYDNWDTTGWADDETSEKRAEGYKNASGVSIHEEVMDGFVMMRLAQLIYEGKVESVTDYVVRELGGNGGSMMLLRNAEKLKAALGAITLEDAEPTVWKRDDNSGTASD